MLGRRNKNTVEFTISNRTILRIIIFLLGTVLLFRVLENMRHPLTLIFVSFFLALALNPAVTWLASKLKSKSRAGGTALAYIAVTIVLVTFIISVVPPLVSQTTEFIRDVPNTLSELQDQDSAVGRFVRRYELQEQIQNFGNDWTRNLGSVKGPVVNTANRILSNVISIITVFVLTFMMLVEGPKWMKIIWKRVPEDRRAHDKDVAKKIYKVVTSYANGQVLVSSIGALFSLVTLIIMSTIIGVTVNAVALAGIVFLFGLIPTIGAILGAVFVTLFTLFVSPTMAIAILIYFIVYQQIENATIQPIIQSRGNDLTPMLVFIAVIMGIGLGGVLGGFLAIPIAGAIKVLIDDYFDNGNSTKGKKSSS